MIVFKKRKDAQRICNIINSLGMNKMPVAVAGGWIISKAKGVNTNG